MTTFSEWMRGEGRESTTELALPEAARAFQGERAGFASRVAACCIDVGLVILLMMGVWLAIELIQLVFSPGLNVEPPKASTLVIWGYFFTTFYWTVAWATSGRSFGAWVMGVRVVNRKGEKLSWPLSLLRAGFSVGFPFGLLWALFSKRNRSLQDIALRTIVIYDWVVGMPKVTLPGKIRP
ncbi:MAG: RDD family protein [Candidatus Nanopelagicales bacterium]